MGQFSIKSKTSESTVFDVDERLTQLPFFLLNSCEVRVLDRHSALKIRPVGDLEGETKLEPPSYTCPAAALRGKITDTVFSSILLSTFSPNFLDF